MNVTIENLLEAQRTILETVDDIGTVLTRERCVDDAQWTKLFKSQNQDESSKGVMILWQEMEQSVGERMCTVDQVHTFSYEFIYPYDDNRADGQTSYAVFIDRLQAINNAINNEGTDFNLGITTLGADVKHRFLQSDGEILVRQWGEGAHSEMTHRAAMTLEVKVTVLGHAESVGS